MAIPDNIKALKPTGLGSCQIRCIGGHYYVYKTTSQWVNGKPKKKTGAALGKITETEGFIPNHAGLELMRKKGITPDGLPHVKNYGAYEMLQQLSPELNGELRRFFPDIFREIRTLALLRVVDGVGPHLAEPAFLSSYMSQISPDLHMSDKTVRKFINELGMRQGEVVAFMRSQVLPGTKLLFDGTAFFADFRDSLSHSGHNPQHSKHEQIRAMYVFDQNTRKPVFYRILQGNLPDGPAFVDTIKACGCRDCLIIADRNFYSKERVSYLMDCGLDLEYILPLRSNTSLVPDDFYADTDLQKFDGVFPYQKKPIYWKKSSLGNRGNQVFTFYDPDMCSQDQGKFIMKLKDQGKDAESMTVLKKTRFGYISFVSNIKSGGEALYLAYKERQELEQCIDFLKNSVKPGPPYAHSDTALYGWAFLNHVSLLYYYGLVNALRKAGLDAKHSTSEMIYRAKLIWAIEDPRDKTYYATTTTLDTNELLEKLGVDLASPLMRQGAHS